MSAAISSFPSSYANSLYSQIQAAGSNGTISTGLATALETKINHYEANHPLTNGKLTPCLEHALNRMIENFNSQAAPTAPTDSTAQAAPTAPTDSTAQAAPTAPTDSTAQAAPTAPTDSTAQAAPTAPTDSTAQAGAAGTQVRHHHYHHHHYHHGGGSGATQGPSTDPLSAILQASAAAAPTGLSASLYPQV